MIRVVGLRKSYGDRAVIPGLTLDFAAGEVVAILGPSGCGKSTLLRCVNGLEAFEGGEIRVGNARLLPPGAATPAARRATLRAIRRDVGFVFQQWNLFAHMTALGNVVEAQVHVARRPLAEAEARARALLERVGLAARAAAYPHQMSGGEQQRVAIARALAMDPKALLLDEPTSALDPARRGEVLAVLRELARDGTTMLLVTHEIRFAREVADRVVVLDGGEVVDEGPAARVLGGSVHPKTLAYLDEGDG